MANSLSTNPIVLTADIASYQAAQTLTAASEPIGVKIRRITLLSAGTTVAGSVAITDPASGRNLVPPIAVAAGVASGTRILDIDLADDPTIAPDFKVVGVTATVTSLYLEVSL
jgi:hypothetical protein